MNIEVLLNCSFCRNHISKQPQKNKVVIVITDDSEENTKNIIGLEDISTYHDNDYKSFTSNDITQLILVGPSAEKHKQIAINSGINKEHITTYQNVAIAADNINPSNKCSVHILHEIFNKSDANNIKNKIMERRNINGY